jgi:flagellar M-ring protein FliF
MSVSVVVDQSLRWDTVGKGKQAHLQKVIDPPSAERMKTIQSIVAAAIGINATRGDQLMVETLPFEATLDAEPPGTDHAAPAKPATKFTPVVIGSIAGGVLLLALLGFFLLRKGKKGKHNSQIEELKKQLAEARATPVTPALNSGEDKVSVSASLENLNEVFKLPEGGTSKTEILTRQVNDQAHKDPAALAQIVRTWLNEPANSK